MAITYTATGPNGEKATRKSAGHVYQEYFWAVWHGGRCEAFSSRRDLAEARCREFEKYGNGKAIALPVVASEPKLSARQRAWLAGLEGDRLKAFETKKAEVREAGR